MITAMLLQAIDTVRVVADTVQVSPPNPLVETVNTALGTTMALAMAFVSWKLGLDKLFSKLEKKDENGNGFPKDRRGDFKIVEAIEGSTDQICLAVDNLRDEIRQANALHKERLDNAVNQIKDSVRLHSSKIV